MWGYVNRDLEKPKNEKAENYIDLVDVWEANNSKMITWINNSVAPSIGMQLAKYEYAKSVGSFGQIVYTVQLCEKIPIRM